MECISKPRTHLTSEVNSPGILWISKNLEEKIISNQ